MRIAYIEAVRLAAGNRLRLAELERRHAELNLRIVHEETEQDESRRDIVGTALGPFCGCFGRLKNVYLAPVESVDLPRAQELPGVACSSVQVPALGVLGSLVAGLTAGTGASSAAVAGVGAFAAASTGAPIASLSGAAATNATLAWLGGGSLAAGGGGIAAGSVVLGGVVAAPAVIATVGFMSWKGRRDRRAQLCTADQLTTAETGLLSEERRTAALTSHCCDVRSVLDQLRALIVELLPAFEALVDRDDDYATWDSGRRRFLAGLVELVSTTVALMAASLADGNGHPGVDSKRLVADARRLLAGLRADEADAA